MRSVISDVRAWEALDSRGRPTVAARVTTSGGAVGRAVAPSGASTGGYEAIERRDGGHRYQGAGVTNAVDQVHTRLAPAIIGLTVEEQEEIDQALVGCDPDPALSGIGGNAVVAVSLAAHLAAAAAAGLPLWQLHSAGDPLLPLPMVNIFSGGAHAARAVDIQDVLAVPHGARSFSQAMEWAARVRYATSEVMTAQGHNAALVADEGGVSADLASSEAAIRMVVDGIVRAGLDPEREVGIAIDVAANQLWGDGGYALAGEDRILTPGEWSGELSQWCSRYPIVSVEDPYWEDDTASWSASPAIPGFSGQLLGDDLFATQEQRLLSAIRGGVANAALIKINQAGTVTRARRTHNAARAAGYGTVISARSGDTEDSWLADLAVGWQSGQIKVGSTQRSERTAKWNRLLEIEALAEGRARFAGAEALAGGDRRPW